ncbi:MAG: hypothetical protein MI922_25900 [Bacteroidales bacterium]|nr:hypothetical protein [Bacteroidales bacterium]
MPAITQYKDLFTVEIDHLYFLNDADSAFADMSNSDQTAILKKYNVGNFISVYPTAACAKTLRQHNLLFRNQARGFKILAKTDTSNSQKPFIELSDIKLQFFLIAKDPWFGNYTSFPLSNNDPTKKYVYYLNNKLANTSSSSYPDLPLPYDAHVEGNDYEMGSIVTHASKVYEAIQNVENSGANPATATDDWTEIDNVAYITSNDRIQIQSNIINYEFNSDDINAAVELVDEEGNTLFSDTIDTSDSMLYQMDFRNIKPGKYTLTIEDTDDSSEIYSATFFMDNELYENKALSIIEITSESGLGDYSLLNGSGEFNAPTYKLRFKNRTTHWRYVDPSDNSTFYESGPHPLTKNGFIALSHSSIDLANPTAAMIKPEDDKVISEVYIST